ncbi:MAG: PAS-domain containing protein [Thalassobaculaceae bacterium]
MPTSTSNRLHDDPTAEDPSTDEARALLEAVGFSGIGIVVLDDDLRLIACNSRFAEINGLDPKDLTPGWDYALLIHSNARRGDYGVGDPEERARDRLTFTREALPFQVERQRSDGTLLLIGGARLPSGTIALTFDERGRQARERVPGSMISYDTLRRALDHSGQGIEIWDAGDRLLYSNPAMERISRESGAPLEIGMTFASLLRRRAELTAQALDEADNDRYVAERIDQHRRSGENHLVPLPDNRWVLVRDAPLPEGGTVTAVSDISDLVRAEQALRDSDKRLRDFVRASSDRFWELDAKLRFTVLMDLKGSAETETTAHHLGLTPWEVADADPDSDQSWHEHRELLERHEPFRDFRYAVRSADGKLRHWRISGVPVFDDKGVFTGYRGTSVDETHYSEELQQAHLALRAALRDAETANRAKSMFLATVSHELRTPLNAIIGFSDLLVSEVFGPLGDPRYTAYARDVQASGHSLLSLIEDMLDLTRAEIGQIMLRESRVDIATEISASVAMVRSRQTGETAPIEVSVPADLPPVWADGRLIRQVLFNLISNALKFTLPSGSVRIEAEACQDGLELRIGDTGIGIRERDIDKVLRPFEQVDSALNRKYEGIGLGLPLSKAFVELHGGTLSIQSELDVGTMVVLRLPGERIGADGSAVGGAAGTA